MDQAARDQLLREVVEPYVAFKADHGFVDFHDLATTMIGVDIPKYDVVVVDEAQDLSANQLRAIMSHASLDGIVTFVTDTAQRIYPRGTTWAECGINAQRTLSLTTNYRNTVQIASLAAALAVGLPMDADGMAPDPTRCVTEGPLPVITKGRFGIQMAYALGRLAEIDLNSETVGFLHLRGGGWFDEVRAQLRNAGYEFCELQGVPDWPINEGNIGLTTFHSAKGLEFDHVFALGLTKDHAAHGDGEEDEQFINLKKLLAMAVGRARQTVTLGMKEGDEVDVFSTIPPQLYELA
jgi:superfamily I DNA/RNA helicase